ncbi:hypothetical protein [Parasphingorhabdus sp.]|uniref:hypothetical protein n=1 Tax=Parasphingorhabdus sp. TaxID=2709688 RepID=UPI003BAF63CE
MPKAPASQFTHSHHVLDDGTVTFKCSSDKDQWPWLALHPFDPIVVQTVNYWASVETSAARGTFDPTKWSALTQTEWTCGKPGVGHATHGIANPMNEEGTARFGLSFFDDDEALVYGMDGTGVVFQNRDFEAWRHKAKAKMATIPAVTNFQYAAANAVGVATQSQSFLSPLIDGKTSCARALITKENGFPPLHPYLSGSGDHVNSTHLADVGRQFASLLLDGEPLTVIGGEMLFTRYVELGRPFDIQLDHHDRKDNVVSMTVQQAERLCATVRIRYLGQQ